MKKSAGNSLAVQCLELRTLTAKGPGSIPGRGTKIPQAVGCGQKEKKLQKKSADEWSPVMMITKELTKYSHERVIFKNLSHPGSDDVRKCNSGSQ